MERRDIEKVRYSYRLRYNEDCLTPDDRFEELHQQAGSPELDSAGLDAMVLEVRTDSHGPQSELPPEPTPPTPEPVPESLYPQSERDRAAEPPAPTPEPEPVPEPAPTTTRSVRMTRKKS